MLDSFCHHLLWSLVISPEHEVSLCPSSVRLYVCQQWLKKTSLKLLGQIQWNITGSFFGWPSPKTTTRHDANNKNNRIVDFLFCFKEHLLWNYKAKCNEKSQEASLGDRLQKYNKASWLTNNNNKMSDLHFCFKEHVLLNKISETNGSNSMKLHGKLPLVTLY